MPFRNKIPRSFQEWIKQGIVGRLITRKEVLFPHYVIYCEVTTRCNLRCKMCSHSKYKTSDGKDMDFSLFTEIIDQIKYLKEKNITFVPIGLGEPLLYPRLSEAIDYVKSHLPYSNVTIVTNGVLLNEKRAREFIELGVDNINISLNATNKSVYEKIMGSNCYDRVVNNIVELLTVRGKSGTRNPTLKIQILKTKETILELEQTFNFWKKYLSFRDTIFAADITSNGGEFDSNELGVHTETWNSQRYPCIQSWNVLAIKREGNLYSCCVPFYLKNSEEDLLLGNVKEKRLKELYFGDNSKIHTIRKKQLRDLYQELPTCLKCDNFNRIPNGWFRNRVFPFIERKWL